MKGIFNLIVTGIIMVTILKNMGEYSNFLDSISPEQYITIVDNQDGTYTAMWRVIENIK